MALLLFTALAPLTASAQRFQPGPNGFPGPAAPGKKWVAHQVDVICERPSAAKGVYEIVPLDSAGAVALARRVIQLGPSDTAMRVREFIRTPVGMLVVLTNTQRYWFHGVKTVLVTESACAQLLGG